MTVCQSKWVTPNWIRPTQLFQPVCYLGHTDKVRPEFGSSVEETSVDPAAKYFEPSRAGLPSRFGRAKSHPLTGKCRVNPTLDHRPLTRIDP